MCLVNNSRVLMLDFHIENHLSGEELFKQSTAFVPILSLHVNVSRFIANLSNKIFLF